MAIEIRHPSEDELRAAMQAGEAAFGEEQKDEDFERHRKMLPRDRFYAAYDGKIPVGTTAAFPFRLTVPGGELSAGGVTWVGVLPSHRRRGLLRDMMRRQLEDLHKLGEPLAILWASEAAIYGRFGYGVAAPTVQMNADRSRFGFRDDPGSRGAVRMVGFEEAATLMPRVYDAARRDVPGFVARSVDWWKEYRLADPEHWRRGAGPKFYAVLEFDGEPVAYALYRIKLDWDEGFSNSQVRLLETCATSPAATRELWRFVFGIDLVTRIQGRHDPGSPLFLMVVDPRSLQLKVSEGLWLRLMLAQAERVRELKPGALGRASALFRTSRPPYCPEDF